MVVKIKTGHEDRQDCMWRSNLGRNSNNLSQRLETDNITLGIWEEGEKT